jgi:CDP-diacylglycerol--serine O-phosphatidyltransferase
MIEALPATDDQPPSPSAYQRSRLSVADLFTLANAACGFLAICSIAALFHDPDPAGGFSFGDRLPSLAVALILVGAACDLVDGPIARKYGGSCLGAQLDNLADAISFGLAPAFLVAVWGTRATSNLALQGAAITAATMCLLAVLVRLARFAAIPAAAGTFMGLPCPMGALTVVAIALLDPPVQLAAPGIVLVAALMVSRITYPKPHGATALVALAWLVCSVTALGAYAIRLPGSADLITAGAGLQILLTLLIPVGMLRNVRP